MAATAFFLYGLVALVLVVNALRRPTPPTNRFPPIWQLGMVASEAAGVWVGVVPVVTAIAVAAGALGVTLGWIGLALAGMAWLGQLEIWRRSRVSAGMIGQAVDLPVSRLARALSWPHRDPDDIEVTEHEFVTHPHRSGSLHLDLYKGRSTPGPSPLAIWVHGGGWRGGSRRRGGLTLLRHLARSGWAVAAIDYPLSPEATFPEHLLGIDAALRWAAHRHDISGPIVLMGASAGAHLAAVAALTRPQVDGLVGMYGIYDFRNRNRIRFDWPLIPRVVMKADPLDDPERYRLASPLDLAEAGGPPTLLIAPGFDSLVPPAESRQFAEALAESNTPVTLLEVPWAQHGFDTLAGRRARAVADAVGRWLDAVILPGSTHERSSRRDG